MRHLLCSLFAVPAVLSIPAVASATAGPTSVETVVTDTTTPVDLKLDDSTVLCSSADYGALFLKVLIPDLARLTLLDHQNLGAGAPCVASGACAPGNMPSDILDPAHPVERVDVNVKEVRLDQADPAAQTCTTTLIERVHVSIRGVDFYHQRTSPLGSRPYADCATSASTDPSTGTDPGSDAGSDTPADDPGAADEPKTGGCDATGPGAGLGLALVGLGAVVARRRRCRQDTSLEQRA
jgi:uncharacterized protein (TIGR03382 family)